MKIARKRRLLAVAFIMTGVFSAVLLSLYALSDNINLFYTPTEVISGEAPAEHNFRVGGLVADNSIENIGDDLAVQFVITDNKNEILVHYNGIIPDLFREGQGIVATGKLIDNIFIAHTLLARHDENYMPKEVYQALNHVS